MFVLIVFVVKISFIKLYWTEIRYTIYMSSLRRFSLLSSFYSC